MKRATCMTIMISVLDEAQTQNGQHVIGAAVSGAIFGNSGQGMVGSNLNGEPRRCVGDFTKRDGLGAE